MKARQSRNADYSRLKGKLLARFAVTAGISFIILSALYIFAWRGHVANVVVRLLTGIFGMDIWAARSWYHSHIGSYSDVLFLASVLIVFFVLLNTVLNWFTRYFLQINGGISQLLSDTEKIRLPDEMLETERKLNEVKEELARRDKDRKAEEARKNDLVMYLAHDIRTPLTSVIRYLNLLNEKEGISPEKKKEYAGIALDKAYRLEKMVNEFFDITRLNAQEIRLHKESVDLDYLLVQLTDELTPFFSLHGNKAVLDIGADLTVMGDSEKLARAFGNILKNAGSYSDPGTEILIRAEATEGLAQISVTDQGNTLSESDLSAIFEKFYRLDSARKSTTGGTGLGLAIAKEIIELHGGHIRANSEKHTVTFTVTLPLKPI